MAIETTFSTHELLAFVNQMFPGIDSLAMLSEENIQAFSMRTT